MSEDECWDLVDGAGVPLGRTHRRGDEDWPGANIFHVLASTCVVRPDGRVLLTQRAAAKDHPLRWEFPAGSVASGETSVDGARRELREETGLDTERCCFERVVRLRERRALLDIYIVRWRDEATLVLDPAEVADSQWVTWAEVDRLCRERRMAEPWIVRLAEVGDELRLAVRDGVR